MKISRRVMAWTLSVLMLGSSCAVYADELPEQQVVCVVQEEEIQETSIEMATEELSEQQIETEVIEETETESELMTSDESMASVPAETEEVEDVVETEEVTESEAEEEKVELYATTVTYAAQNLMNAAKVVADYIRTNHYTYGAGANQVTCDIFVCWAMWQAGYENIPHPGSLGLWGLQQYCEEHGFQKITNLADCQPGDIMMQTWVSNSQQLGHTYILGMPQSDKQDTFDTMWGRYDGGSDNYISSVQPIVTWKIAGLDKFVCAYRPNTNGLKGAVAAPSVTPDSYKNYTVSGLKAASISQGVQLSWGATEAPVSGYYIYGMNGENSKYHYIGLTANTSFVDLKASMTNYNYYWVIPYYKAASGTMVGSCKSYVYGKRSISANEVMQTNTIGLVANSTANGVQLFWQRNPGVSTYAIYRKTASGKMQYIGTTTGVSFLDKNASASDYNFYWVYPYTTIGGKQYFGKCSTYKYGKKLVTAANFNTLTLDNLHAKSTEKGITLSWNGVSGANGYEIYRKTGNGEMHFVTQTQSTSYADTLASPLADNTYWIYPYRFDQSGIAVLGKASQINAGSAILSDTTMNAVEVNGLTAARTNAGVKLSWTKTEGAQGYYIYTKSATAGVHYVGTTTNTTWTHTSAVSGQSYYWVYPYYKSSTGKVYMGRCLKYVAI